MSALPDATWGATGVAPVAATSVLNDCTRPCAWAGGTAPLVLLVQGAPGALEAINQVTHPCALVWSGLGVVVRALPRPPPTCPTIMRDMGTVFAVVAPVGVNDRLFVRLIVKLVNPVLAAGTVITTGDHVEGTVDTVDTDAGFNAAQVAVAPVETAPQK